MVGQQPHGSGAGRLDRLQSFSTKTIAAILLFIALVVKLHEVKKKKKKEHKPLENILSGSGLGTFFPSLGFL